MKTELEPAFKLATCGAHGGLGGNGCDTVGAPTTIAFILSTFTEPSVFELAIVVLPVQPCPVLKLSPTLLTADIILFIQ
jgi:hypothetical protein